MEDKLGRLKICREILFLFFCAMSLFNYVIFFVCHYSYNATHVGCHLLFVFERITMEISPRFYSVLSSIVLAKIMMWIMLMYHFYGLEIN